MMKLQAKQRLTATAPPDLKTLKLIASEGDADGVPHLTAELAAHIIEQYQTEGIHALTKSLVYGDGAAKELAELFVKALRSYESSKMKPQLRLNAKARLLASSTYDQDSQPQQNMNVNVTADVDEDSKHVIETELGDAKRGHAAAKARGHTDAVAHYENLIAELERASAPVTAMPVENLVANDTSDQPGLPCANPADCAVDGGQDSQAADNVIMDGPAQMPCLLDADSVPDDETEFDPADPNGEDVLKLDTTASTEDPISDGAAFDMLIDGDEEEDEPLVQELTNNDGGVEPDKLQPLLIDDISEGPPVL